MDIFTAELIGTAILILLGDGVVAGVLLAHSKAQNAGWIVITFGWGMAVAIAIYAVGQFSGAQINPAVTISFALVDITPWSDVPEVHCRPVRRGGDRCNPGLPRIPAALAADGRPRAEARRLLDSAGDPQLRAEPGDRDHRHIPARLWRARDRRALRGVSHGRRRANSTGDGFRHILRAAPDRSARVRDRPFAPEAPPGTRSTRPATSDRGSSTRSCRSPASGTRTGVTRGFPS